MSGYGPGSAPVYTQVMEFDGNDNPIFVGSAVQGTAKSAAGWRISKITYSGVSPTDIQFAGGSQGFDQVWNDRAGLSYS